MEEIKKRKYRRHSINGFIECLKNAKGEISEFDDELWCGLVDYVIANAKDDIRIVFKNGDVHFI
jgi:hypothetical protein